MDAGVLMDRDDVLKDWPNKKDSDIAEETFRAYGLDAVVTDTSVVHDEEVSTIIQRETDMQFLQRLAIRNGYECFIDATTGYFRPPAVEPTRPVGAGDPVRRPDEPDSPAARGHRSGQHRGHDVPGRPRLQGGAGRRRRSRTAAQARRDGLARLPPAGPGALARPTPPSWSPPAPRRWPRSARGCATRAEWFVTGEGELDSGRYGSILKPRMTVLVKGAGRTYSGTYYVTRVTHTFTRDGYMQLFGVKRNALTVTGTEDFTVVTP